VVDSSRNGYYDILKKLFSEHSIKFDRIIGESFDGAANMRGGIQVYNLRLKVKKTKKTFIYGAIIMCLTYVYVIHVKVWMLKNCLVF
jgi:hypothetical protein